jgi:hypothetical protein
MSRRAQTTYLNKPFPEEMKYNDFYDCEFGKDYDGKALRIVGRSASLMYCWR